MKPHLERICSHDANICLPLGAILAIVRGIAVALDYPCDIREFDTGVRLRSRQAVDEQPLAVEVERAVRCNAGRPLESHVNFRGATLTEYSDYLRYVSTSSTVGID